MECPLVDQMRLTLQHMDVKTHTLVHTMCARTLTHTIYSHTYTLCTNTHTYITQGDTGGDYRKVLMALAREE